MSVNERVLLSQDVVPSKYELRISTNIKGDFKFTGHVDVHLALKADGIKDITLHAHELEIEGCTFSAKDGQSFSSTSVEFDKTEETVKFNFSSSLPKGTGILSMDFIGLHNNEMAGFYRSGYQKDGERKIMLSTQFEPLAARRCFPCVDEPAAKATFALALEVDKELTALSNMPIVSTSETNGRMEYKFAESPKMSTYLVAFCVGEFDYVQTTTKHNVQLRVYTPLGKKNMGDFALHVGAETLDLYDGMFGKPFPLPKMDMIAIPEFAMGAMENWGLVTYREVALLIDSDSASSQQKQRVATVVAHELAHQWFGNLVTMQWWDDLWLNEGFATWMQNYATDFVYPDWKLWEQFVVTSQAQALSLDSLVSSHPIQVPIKRAQEVEEVFDGISYAKGGCVVRLIYAYLGHDNFVEGLKLYMDRHQYGNTETHHLWNAWETVSKLPVNKVMASWTEQMGFPVITVNEIKVNNGMATVQLNQKWFLADGTLPEEEKDKKWSIPMFVTTELGDEKLDLMTESSQQFQFKVGKQGWFKLNGGQNVPLRVNYPENHWKALGKQVSTKALKEVDRSGLVMDAFALVKAGSLDPGFFLEFLRSYNNEDAYPVWCGLGTPISELRKILAENAKLVDQFNELAGKLVLPAFEKVSWNEKDSDGHLGKLLRAELIGHCVHLNNDKIIEIARKRFDSYVKNPKAAELPSEYRASVFRMVLKASESNVEYDSLMGLLDKLENDIEKKDILLSLGYVKSKELKLKTVEWACTPGNVKLQDFFYAVASVSMSGYDGLEITWNYLKENFEAIEKMLQGASPSLMGAMILYSCSGFSSMEQAEEIKEFFNVHKTKMQRKVDQIVEGTRNAAKLKDIVLGSDRFLAALK